MFSKELNELIMASVVDGVISDQERAVLRKRALLEGVDPEEVDVLLQARLQEVIDYQLSERAAQSSRRCPNCGAALPPLSGICPNCGAAVAMQGTSGSDRELVELVGKLENALSHLKMGIGSKAYVEGLMLRARTLYGDDPKVKHLLAAVGQELERVRQRRRRTMIATITAACAVAAIIIFFAVWAALSSGQRGKEEQAQKRELVAKAQKQRNDLCAQIDELPEPDDTNYKQAARLLLNIQWSDIAGATLNGGNSFEKQLFKLERQEKERFLDKKRAYAKQLKALYEKHGDESSAPDEVRYPSLYMKY